MKPKLLFICRFSCFDPLSGATRSCKTILESLAKKGWDVVALGLNRSESQRGLAVSRAEFGGTVFESTQELTRMQSENVRHELVNIAHETTTETELDSLWRVYEAYLKDFKPDIVFGFGGKFFDRNVFAEASNRSIVTVAYLVNANYEGSRWARDVTYVVTDSTATRDLYRERGLNNIHNFGKFVSNVTLASNPKTHDGILKLLFVAPTLQKGAGIVAQLAKYFRERQEFRFTVVESRGDWGEIAAQALGHDWEQCYPYLEVVKPSPNLGKLLDEHHVLLAPSLWFESGSRTIVEASLRGLPIIATSNGGNEEMAGNGGFFFRLPKKYHRPPYQLCPSIKQLHPVCSLIEHLQSNPEAYVNKSQETLFYAKQKHDISSQKQNLDKNFRRFREVVNINRVKSTNVISINSRQYFARKHISTGETSDIFQLDSPLIAKCLRFNADPVLFKNEVQWLSTLQSYDCFPQLIDSDESANIILMTDCGEPLKPENFPKDGRQQIECIINLLIENDCLHGDLSLENLTIKNGRIFAIDFGSAMHRLKWSRGESQRLKLRIFFDQHLHNLVQWQVAKNHSDKRLWIGITYEADLTASEISESIQYPIITRFQIFDELISVFSQKLSKSFLSKRVNIEEINKQQTIIAIIGTVQVTNIINSHEISNALNIQSFGYFTDRPVEVRELLQTLSVYRRQVPYTFWQQWWDKHHSKPEIAGLNFQDKRQGLEDRWRLVESALVSQVPRGGRILDVGSNAGDTCLRLAASQYEPIGIEYDSELAKLASKRCKNKIRIINKKFTPEIALSFSDCQAALLLSVLHRIWAIDGKAFAEECLANISQVIPVIVIEGAVAISRYKGSDNMTPPFLNNDIEHCIDWHLDWIKNCLVGNWEVSHIGDTPHTSSEPLRPLFVCIQVSNSEK